MALLESGAPKDPAVLFRRWYREAAETMGLGLSDPDAREIIYGMPYKEWQAKYQKDATPEQKAALAKSHPGH